MNKISRSLIALTAFLFAFSSSAATTVTTCKSHLAGEVNVFADNAGEWSFSLESNGVKDNIEEFSLVAQAPDESTIPEFSVEFLLKRSDLQHHWDPSAERFPCSWTSQDSSFSTGLPIRANFDDEEKNVATWAVSDALNMIKFATRINMVDENDHGVKFRAVFFSEPSAPAKRYETKLRLDMRRVFWADAISDGVKWIADVSSRYPAVPPESAYWPLYSSWYVFRSNVTQDAMEREIERAAKLGMKVAILDDGWQRDRGAWAINTSKFPDMKGHVERVKKMGVKYMLWFALPHVRKDSPVFEEFKDMLLWEGPDQWNDYIFDPRYPKVRKHIVNRLAELARDYGFDGFKLDFIDQFVMRYPDPPAKYNYKGCDTKSVPEATEKLLKEIREELDKVRPGMLIEFRQRYIGPVVRQYGNMLRANDCPGDYMANRYRTLALRIISPGSAVHSDMLLWRNDDKASDVKRQIWNVIFSVVQYSAYLKDLPEEHKKAIRETIKFAEEHRDTLLFGRLIPHRPELGYPCVEAESAEKRIVVVYQSEWIAKIPDDSRRVILVNATTADSLVIETKGGFKRINVKSGEYTELESYGL
ncbi:MAG: alpha-galactosidase [Kiritimatiellae bacterium]|nr:alpha-galactosidase [Kiritimatiellia bacterium]